MTRRLAVVALLLAAGLADAQEARKRPRPKTKAQPVVVAEVTGNRPVDVFLNLINQERWEQGLKPVSLDPMLTRYSYYNSLEQAARGEPGHFVLPPDWKRQNSAMAPQGVEQAFRVWMDSTPHRAGMMDPTIRWVGIAGHPPYWTMNAR